MRINKHGSIELTSREILILVIAIIIAAVVIGIAVAKLGVVQKTFEFLAGQGNALSAT